MTEVPTGLKLKYRGAVGPVAVTEDSYKNYKTLTLAKGQLQADVKEEEPFVTRHLKVSSKLSLPIYSHSEVFILERKIRFEQI